MRMAEATARMCLRDYVRDDDIDFAIKVSKDLFKIKLSFILILIIVFVITITIVR